MATGKGSPMEQVRTDILILGSGIGGLTLALECSGWADVVIVTKKHRSESNTNYAQGGIASVLAADDSIDLHIRDTLEAGDGLCHADIVAMVVREGPPLIEKLLQLGVAFTREDSGALELGREGGHSRRRIIHAADQTGREIERALRVRVRGRAPVATWSHRFTHRIVPAKRKGNITYPAADFDQRHQFLNLTGGIKKSTA